MSEHLVPVIQLLVDQGPTMGQRHMLRILKVGEKLHWHRQALAGVPVGRGDRAAGGIGQGESGWGITLAVMVCSRYSQ